ncbi:MAG: hypothetical protein ABIQ44_08745 [Chloroflexia bacterium]
MKFLGKTIRRQALSLSAVLALAFLALPFKPVPAVAQTSADLAVGPVSTLAIDNVGGGWGWTGPANPNDSGHLLRFTKNIWTEVPRTNFDAGKLSTAAAISDIALTGNGKSGWALGTGNGNRLWHLTNGVWSDVPPPFNGDYVWSDLTMSADGSSGWIVASDKLTHYLLARLVNNQWIAADQPAEGEMRFISLSPDGQHGWGVGPKGADKDIAVRMDKNAWVAGAFQLPHNMIAVTADNQGNGWAVAPPVSSALYRLTPKGVQSLIPDSRLDKPEVLPGMVIQSVGVNGAGKGWAIGTYEKPGNPLLEVQPVNQPLFFWLNGDRILQMPLDIVPTTTQGTTPNYAGPIAISPDGSHTWLGVSTGDSKFVKIVQLKEAWPYDAPEQADQFQGAGICFNESPYCLRGLFADFWQKHGGLDALGYPITPEIYEISKGPQIGGPLKMVVQYTERARIEWHQDLEGSPHEALLGLLGNSLVENRLAEAPFKPAAQKSGASTQFFPETQHNLTTPFLEYWKANEGVPTFGYPRSEAFEEKSATDGKTYTVQYFERNRIEYHPENKGTKYEYLLGLLGVEQFKATYGFQP